MRERLGDQVVLGAEVVEDQRRAHVQRLRHVGHPRGREPEPVEQLDRRREDLLAAYLHRPPRPAGHHAASHGAQHRAEPPVTDVSDLAPPEGRELVQMLPAEAYTSEDVLAWERRHLYAGGVDLPGPGRRPVPARRAHPARGAWSATSRACVVRDERRSSGCSRTPAGTAATSCCPRAARRPGARSAARTTPGPTTCGAAEGRPRASARSRRSTGPSTGWSSCRWRSGTAGCSATRCTRSGAPEVPPFERYVGDLARHAGAVRHRVAGGRRPAHLRGGRELEGDRGELPRVLPLPADPSRAVPGDAAGLRRQLRPAGRLDRRRRWSCATGWRPCRWTARWPRRRCPG